MSTTLLGPRFTVESDRAVITLGNSERREIGELWASTLDARRIFRTIDIVTLNEADGKFGRVAVRKLMEDATVLSHSAGVSRVAKALQIIAFNPPEPVNGRIELIRRAMAVGEDEITPEPGAVKTGCVDLAKASFELARSPISSARTLQMIGHNGYSAVGDLAARFADFPAGRAIVHGDQDTFGFYVAADIRAAVDNDITVAVIEDAHHNEILFRPGYIMDQITPGILPSGN